MVLKDLLKKARITQDKVVVVRGVNYQSEQKILSASESSTGSYNTREIGNYQGYNYSTHLISNREPLILTPLRAGNSNTVMGCWTKMAEDSKLSHEEIKFMKEYLPVWSVNVNINDDNPSQEYTARHQFSISAGKQFDLNNQQDALEYHMLKWYFPNSETQAKLDKKIYYLEDVQVQVNDTYSKYNDKLLLSTKWLEAIPPLKYQAMMVYNYLSNDLTLNAVPSIIMSLEDLELQYSSIIFDGPMNDAKRLLGYLTNPNIEKDYKAVMALSLNIVYKDVFSHQYKLRDGDADIASNFEELVRACDKTHKERIDRAVYAAIMLIEDKSFVSDKLTKDDILAYYQGQNGKPEPKKK